MKGRRLLTVAGMVGLALCTDCNCTPTITALVPPSGPPRTVVEVQGTNLFLKSIRWDEGLPSQVTLPTSLGGDFFTVPAGAVAGAHPVAAVGTGGTSNILNFTVTVAVPFPAPRLDDVTVNLFQIDSSGASFFLMAHGANFDVGAKIFIDGTEQATFFSRLLRNNLPGAPATFGYPIYHWATVWCFLGNRRPGSAIQVKVRNLDGQESATRNYTIAASMAALDSDGDGIPDQIEVNGIDTNGDGTPEVDLRAMGADPLRKDVFVEADWMTGAAPAAAIWTTAVNSFANLPVLNSDGSAGISLWVDRGQGGAFTGGGTVLTAANCIHFGGTNTATNADLYVIKGNAANFQAARLNVFHYTVFGFDDGACSGTCATGPNSGCSSGRTEGFVANDFYVTCPWCANNNALAGTFLHELGHNLGLFHGGNVGTNRKPNYPSIMSYRYQFPGVSTDCNLTPDGVYTYSSGTLATLNEANLNEPSGICNNQAIDWNGNGNATQVGVAADINADGNAAGVLQDFADVPGLNTNFTAAGSQWGGN